MVWGAIARGRKFPLVFFEPGSINSATYVDKVVHGPLKRAVRQLAHGWDDVLVVEDNAPIHRSNVSEAARHAAGINLLPHPPNSPDLNPIKHMWSIAKYRVSRMPRASNLDALREQTKKAWDEIPMGVVNGLVATMEERRLDVQRKKGWHTRF